MLDTILSNFHLERILYIIKRRLAAMIIIGAIGGVLGGAYSMFTATTLYRAEVSFYLYSNPDYVYDSSVNISSGELSAARQLASTYRYMIKSKTVLDQVIEQLGLVDSVGEPLDHEILGKYISSYVVNDTAVFTVCVDNTDPYMAMQIANAIGEIAPGEIQRIAKSGGIEMIDAATLPEKPYETANTMKFIIIGFAGLGGLSFLWFMVKGLLDTTIRRGYEIKLVFNIPILGNVPQMIAEKKGEKPKTILCDESTFAIKESYSKIRANLLFTGKGEKCPVYAITSAEQNDGKSLNALNLAISYAQLGKKVLLIDADMRNASIGRHLGYENDNGLSQKLAGICREIKVNKYNEYLDVVCAGTMPPNPSELLAGPDMEKLINENKEKYDCIFIDLPPVGIVSDAMVLVQLVTAYVMIVRFNQSKMNKLKGAVDLMEQVGANICGFVFNDLNSKSADYAYQNYDYSYHYGDNEAQSKTSKKKKRK